MAKTDSDASVPSKMTTISFSHFLPRSDLIFPTPEVMAKIKSYRDPLPQFNFSRVAGSTLIENQLRAANSILHIYGHQHRNRWRLTDGVTYMSHCLGYPKEREGLDAEAFRERTQPKLVWSEGALSQHPFN